MQPPCPAYPEVLALALELLAGAELALVDEHGRHWRATATSLDLVLPGSGASAPVLEGTAADVALEVVRRRLACAGARSEVP